MRLSILSQPAVLATRRVRMLYDTLMRDEWVLSVLKTLADLRRAQSRRSAEVLARLLLNQFTPQAALRVSLGEVVLVYLALAQAACEEIQVSVIKHNLQGSEVEHNARFLLRAVLRTVEAASIRTEILVAATALRVALACAISGDQP
jgi:hypothetical protein